MIDLASLELWFVAGSQHLYGPGPLEQVADDARAIAAGLDAAEPIPLRVVCKGVVTTPGEVLGLCQEAQASDRCVGLVAWMHTFSPAKMWIAGLQALRKPMLHLHTQMGRDIPWDTIDMDFMNLHQSAHGGREFGFMATRLGQNRRVVVGHWRDPAVVGEVAQWARAAAAWHDSQRLTVLRLGDNMRQVAVTEGDKVEAQRVLGYAVNGWGVGDLAQRARAVPDAAVDELCGAYAEAYDLAPTLRPGGDQHAALRDEARTELGLRALLAEAGALALTDTFEDLHGLARLPGLAIQRLMAEGYGFAAEGDWKTAALVRAMKVMAHGLPGGVSFMEDYTYHFDPAQPLVLGAHMLEVCPSIASGRPRCEVHPLSIGGKADPVRLVFDGAPGPAVNASIIDLGDRFRMVVNAVDAVAPPRPMPRLPVARVLWAPRPGLRTAAAAWVYAGGAHHTGFSHALGPDDLRLLAEFAGIECVVIDEHTRLDAFRDTLRHNAAYHHLTRGPA